MRMHSQTLPQNCSSKQTGLHFQRELTERDCSSSGSHPGALRSQGLGCIDVGPYQYGSRQRLGI